MTPQIADLCFPYITQTKADIVAQYYPNRPQGQIVTRIAPSPTGFVHLGALYTGLINLKFAHQQGGIFMLRIEDTDQQRLIENGVQIMIDGLSHFDIIANEGPTKGGKYGPYIQSERKLIYQILAKDLIAQGKAYPCFLTTEEIEQTRSIQTAGKQLPGIYGNFAPYRNKSYQEIKDLIDAGKPFVIRLLSSTQADERVEYIDLIKGPISAQANINDIVLIKSDGLTTYHFAHIVDDYLMGTTHVIRADERVPSVPLHIQLHQAMRGSVPRWHYAHVAPLLKSDQGGKRKLSKRKDPEADVMYLIQSAYPTEAIKEYLMTIIDSKYEDWKKENHTRSYREYEICLEDMNVAGALVDMLKLRDISKEYCASLSAEQLYTQFVDWYHLGFSEDKEIGGYLDTYHNLILSALQIERGDILKDPKRFVTYHDVINHIRPFIDELYDHMQSPALSLSSDIVQEFISAYIPSLDLTVSKESWFENLKMIGSQLGYASNNQEYKTGNYKGKIGDLAMVLRILLFKSSQTPDLYESMQVMGIERVKQRLSSS